MTELYVIYRWYDYNDGFGNTLEFLRKGEKNYYWSEDNGEIYRSALDAQIVLGDMIGRKTIGMGKISQLNGLFEK